MPSPNGLVINKEETTLFLAVTRGNCIWRVPLPPPGEKARRVTPIPTASLQRPRRSHELLAAAIAIALLVSLKAFSENTSYGRGFEHFLYGAAQRTLLTAPPTRASEAAIISTCVAPTETFGNT